MVAPSPIQVNVNQLFQVEILEEIHYHVAAAGKSSNGRTHDSGSWNRGSNPCFPATQKSLISPDFLMNKNEVNKMNEFIKGPRFRLLLAILIACSFFMAQSLPKECDCSQFGFCEFNLINASSDIALVVMIHDEDGGNDVWQKYEISAGQTIKVTVISGWWYATGYKFKDNKITNAKYWDEFYMEPGEVKNLTYR